MARERINQQTASDAVVMQSLLFAVWHGGESARAFRSLIDKLQGD